MKRTYTTKQGDKWDSVAYHQLGSAAYADRLMQCNAQFLNHYTFPAGIMLELPEVSAVADSAVDSLPPWKQVAG